MNSENNRQSADEVWEVDPDQVETVLVGQVGPARGLVGEVLVRPLTDQPQVRFAVGETLYDEDSTAYPICKYRIIKNRHCLTFSNVTNRNQAEAIRGRKLYADIVPDWEAEEDAYRNEELAGLPVLSRLGLENAGITDLATLNLNQLPANLDLNQVTLGKVNKLVFGAVQDLLEVKCWNPYLNDVDSELDPVLVPFVQALVVEVNVDAGYLVCDPPLGLFPVIEAPSEDDSDPETDTNPVAATVDAAVDGVSNGVSDAAEVSDGERPEAGE